jgi:uncharacterized protein YjaZ
MLFGEQAIGQWVQHYNHERFHEALNNLTPADVYPIADGYQQCFSLKTPDL